MVHRIAWLHAAVGEYVSVSSQTDTERADIARETRELANQCARDGVDHPRYLLRLVELELIDRERRMVERRTRQARFPATKSLGTFEFTAMPSLNKMLVLELPRCGYVLVARTSSRWATRAPARSHRPRPGNGGLPEGPVGYLHHRGSSDA